MACDYPLHGFRAPGGQVRFTRSGAYADLPITVPCGQCAGCRLERSRQWAVRIMHEAQTHDYNSFITLTYDDEHLPKDGSLVKKDWQDFAKRFRKRIAADLLVHPKGPKTFRYFHCGEYGDLTGRPHGHACIFGLDFYGDRVKDSTTKQGHALYTSKTLDDLWTHGQCWIGDLSFESAAYVARYIMKKQLGECAWKRYGTTIDCNPGQAGTWHTSNRFTLEPEYATMSLKPGIGKAWIDKYLTDVYPSDEVIINGKSCRPPTFYDKQLEKADPTLLRIIKARRLNKAKQHEGDQTYDRLLIRQNVRTARMRNQKRN